MAISKFWLIGAGSGVAALIIIVVIIFSVFTGNSNQLSSPEQCRIRNLENEINNFELEAFSLQIADEVFECSDEVVLVPADADFNLLLLASQLAGAAKSPMIVYNQEPAGSAQGLSQEIYNELFTLFPFRINVIGTPELAEKVASEYNRQNLPDTEVIHLNPEDADLIRSEIARKGAEPESFDTASSASRSQKIIQLMLANAGVEYKVDSSFSLNSSDPEQASLDLATSLIHESRPSGPAWFVSNSENELAAIALPALEALGGNLLYANSAQDLRGFPEIAVYLKSSRAEAKIIGKKGPDSDWQLRVLAASDPLPSGKYLLFEQERMVAYYGIPWVRPAGILGIAANAVEGTFPSPEVALFEMESLLEAYETEGVQVTPVFEIIATNAANDPGADENYSNEFSVGALLPWVQEAKELGVYVVLDLQPGRTDFLTQAKMYEPLLSYENVGLALDPEWRLQPDQLHNVQIGIVDAEEVNEVVDWLANLVREKNLPQKLLLVHQFRVAMITHRANIKSPPELAIVINMDGLGTPEEKLGTYDVIAKLLGDEPDRFWGFKNFFQADNPTFEPEAVLELDPLPVFINYQ